MTDFVKNRQKSKRYPKYWKKPPINCRASGPDLVETRGVPREIVKNDHFWAKNDLFWSFLLFFIFLPFSLQNRPVLEQKIDIFDHFMIKNRAKLYPKKPIWGMVYSMLTIFFGTRFPVYKESITKTTSRQVIFWSNPGPFFLFVVKKPGSIALRRIHNNQTISMVRNAMLYPL